MSNKENALFKNTQPFARMIH